MNKKVLSLLLCGAMALSLAACTNTPSGSSSDTQDTATSDVTPSTDDSTGENTPDTGSSEVTKGKVDQELLNKALEAIKEKLGDNYVPSTGIDMTYLAERCGVTADNVDVFAGEIPMISVNVDSVYIINAKEGKGADVKAELEAYKTSLVEDSVQYPMNMPIVSEAVVGQVEGTDVVYFLCLGGETGSLESDEEIAAQAKDLCAQAQAALEEVIVADWRAHETISSLDDSETEFNPAIPPEVKLIDLESNLPAESLKASACDWNYGEGVGIGTAMEGSGVINHSSLPLVDIASAEQFLQSPVRPQEYKLVVYSASDVGKENVVPLYTFADTIPEDGEIEFNLLNDKACELTLYWSQENFEEIGFWGNATYYFTTN